MNRIRVLLVEDQAIVREALRLLLETQPDIEVVADAGDGHEALDKAEALKVDVAVMDLAMPGMDGVETTRMLRKRLPDIRVLILSGHESEDCFFRALRAGALGYVVKGGAAGELFSGVRAVARGEVFLQPALARSLVDDYLQLIQSNSERDSFDTLSDREREVFLLMAQGYSNKEIADRLTLSPNTAHSHQMHVMQKLHLTNRVELVKYALNRGLLRPCT